jgi:hypothetical protein
MRDLQRGVFVSYYCMDERPSFCPSKNIELTSILVVSSLEVDGTLMHL